MIAPDHHRRLHATRAHELVDREAGFRAVAVAEPADPRGQPLERHPFRRELQPPLQQLIAWEQLAQRPGVVKSRNQLLDVAYNDDIYVDDRTIDSHIKRIRRKFRAAAADFDAIETLYGVGYRFDEQ